MSRICLDCTQGTFEFIDVDDATITVECDTCSAVYTLESDGLGEAGFEWIEAMEKLHPERFDDPEQEQPDDDPFPHVLIEEYPEEEMIIISPARKWVRNPITSEKETIKEQWIPDAPIYCPNCQAHGRWEMIATKDHIVVLCGACKQHCWCGREEEGDEKKENETTTK